MSTHYTWAKLKRAFKLHNILPVCFLPSGYYLRCARRVCTEWDGSQKIRVEQKNPTKNYYTYIE